jgi:hypothetical protein
MNSPRRIRLTREELLAGKCMPDAHSSMNDPRIKSPDKILQKNFDPANDIPPIPTEKTVQLQRELGELKLRYNREINDWKEYEKNVTEWKKQVLGIVQQLKMELILLLLLDLLVVEPRLLLFEVASRFATCP